MWQPEHLEEGRPVYQAIAEALGRDIQAGRLRPGERLPTHRALAGALGVNVVTVTRAYAAASRRGWIEGEVGRGTFVSRPRRLLPTAPLSEAAAGGVDFQFNLPAADPDLWDAPALLAELAADPEGLPLDVGYTAPGLDRHREAGARWMADFGVAAEPSRTMVCGGVQHAMALVLSSLAAPGDTVLTDEFTYPGIKALARVLHLRLVGVAADDEGLLPDALEAAARATRARALYAMPTLQNPTGRVLSAPRREALMEVARRHGLVVLEDDTYGFLHPEPPAPLAALAPELVVSLVGTSKSLLAGLRTGFVHLPEEGGPTGLTVDRLAAQVAALGWMAAPTMAEITTRWIDDGTAGRLVASKRVEAAHRRTLLEERLPGRAPGSHPFSSHVWLGLPSPWRAEDLESQARARGVALAPAHTFAVGRPAEGEAAVRVCLATPPRREDVQAGIEVLCEVLAGAPAVIV